jgi:hypothetical protein
MNGAIPPLPNTPPWRGAQLKYRDNFTFITLCVITLYNKKRDIQILVAIHMDNAELH